VRDLLVWSIAVLIAMPMFWIGFVAGRTIWLVPGLATVLLANLALLQRRTHKEPS
jgi:hypothetical protein